MQATDAIPGTTEPTTDAAPAAPTLAAWLRERRIHPMRMPYDIETVPHAVIEVNQRCNITCRACYKDMTGTQKPLAQILREVDIIAAQRRLGAISIAGGEPTLHPELPEVIRYIVGKGIVAQMLSNGVRLTDEQLAAYKRAGLSTIYLHIDSQQCRPDAPKGAGEQALDGLRLALAERIRGHGLNCALNVTLYQDNLAELGAVVDFLLSNTLYSRLLVTCCKDFDRLVARLRGEAAPGHTGPLAGQEVGLEEVVPRLLAEHGMEPFGCVGAQRDPEGIKWVFYFSYVIGLRDGSKRVLHATHGFKNFLRLAQALSMRLKGRYPSGRIQDGSKAVIACLVYALFSLSPKVVWQVARFLVHLLRPGARIFQKSFIFQGGPTLSGDGRLDYCHSCPDATVRAGEIVPLCTADLFDGKPDRPLFLSGKAARDAS